MALLAELDTRTVLNVVEENFERVGLGGRGSASFTETAYRKTHAIRMIYIGEHVVPKQELIDHFHTTINDVNAGYCEINVFGLLLVYESYFVHVVEGSEDTVHRHLRFLFDREKKWVQAKNDEMEADRTEEDLTDILEEESDAKKAIQMFLRLKLLIVYHSIQTLAFSSWQALTARPPSLVGRLDAAGPIADHMAQLRICLGKVQRICQYIKADTNLSYEGLSAGDPKMESLPEVALLDFLLKSPYILDLRQVVRMHRRVDDYRYYFENVWPLPTHFTPRLLYKLKVDDSFVEPLPVMPWENVKKEVEEEEKEERQSVSSSSD